MENPVYHNLIFVLRYFNPTIYKANKSYFFIINFNFLSHFLMYDPYICIKETVSVILRDSLCKDECPIYNGTLERFI